jgi:TatA/E family protein of Tat protein translocase
MEIAVVGIVAVLLFGSKLPGLARSLGAAIPAFKAGLSEIDRETKDVEREIRKVVQ